MKTDNKIRERLWKIWMSENFRKYENVEKILVRCYRRLITRVIIERLDLDRKTIRKTLIEDLKMTKMWDS